MRLKPFARTTQMGLCCPLWEAGKHLGQLIQCVPGTWQLCLSHLFLCLQHMSTCSRPRALSPMMNNRRKWQAATARNGSLAPLDVILTQLGAARGA